MRINNSIRLIETNVDSDSSTLLYQNFDLLLVLYCQFIRQWY